MYTSLVFLVVLGIWAAYLIQHWMRRREHLLTARSVDAFTEALRVLERRPPATTSTPRPRSYAVSPLRTQPGVVVKHGAGSSVRPVTAAPRGNAMLRAAGLAGVMLLFALAVVGLLLGRVGPLVPLAALLLLAGDIAYLRWSAQVARTSRPQATAATRRAPAEAAAPMVAQPVVEAPAEWVAAEPEPVVEPAPVVKPVAPRPAVPFDIRAYDKPVAEPVGEEPPAPGTWRPTPVPVPLYTRKATVQPLPQASSARAAAETEAYLSPVEIDADLDVDLRDMPSPFGRVVNG